LEDAGHWAAEEAAKPKELPRKQLDSQPSTVSLQPKNDPSVTVPGTMAAAALPKTDGIIGTFIDGRYLIKRLIGEGGMGLVYEAEHMEIGRRVAVKVLHAMYTRQNEVLARFRSEVRAATRIGHPHI